ncbi:MAG: DUF998 domain-containing protein [Promethearchaeota archaeon]|nr:MAG: DUF998 domain-containing protein [Candidatus Lokiarchaeota archaeon]
MPIIFGIMKKLLNVIPAGIFGLLSVFFAFTGILISFVSFPGYNLLFYDVSYLATGPLGIFFDLGLIFSGIVAIPFHYYMNILIIHENIEPRWRKFTLSLSLMSSITLSLIGFFPVLTESIIILIIHGILALLTFIGITIYCFLYGIFFIKIAKFPFLNAILSFLVSAIFIFYFTNRWSLVEWIGVGSIMIWIAYNAIFSLVNKR